MIGMTVRRFAFAAMAGASLFGVAQAQVPSTAAVDFSYSPVTPGAWNYRAVSGGAEAAFVDTSGMTRMIIGCGTTTRLVTLSRVSVMPATNLSIWTSSGSRSLTARFDPSAQRVITQLGSADTLLDAIAFSRGRFAVMMPGGPALVLPAGTEVAHIVEDCRA